MPLHMACGWQSDLSACVSTQGMRLTNPNPTNPNPNVPLHTACGLPSDLSVCVAAQGLWLAKWASHSLGGGGAEPSTALYSRWGEWIYAAPYAALAVAVCALTLVRVLALYFAFLR